MDENTGEEQFGFRRGRETKEAIELIRILVKGKQREERE